MKTAPATKNTQVPDSRAHRWLLAHDITDKKRLQKAWRYLSQEAERLQYSVYLIRGSATAVQAVIDVLATIIDPKTDDVRIYPLTEHTRIWGLGQQFNDEGNVMSDAYLDRMKAHDHPSVFEINESSRYISL